MSMLQGKRIIVTGGASGIGLATVKYLLKEGARVAVADINREGAEEVVQSLQSNRVIAVGVDVVDIKSVKAMIKIVVSAFDGLDGMFNNAGIMLPDDKDVIDTDLTVWDRTLDVNLKGVFLCCRYGIPALLKSGGGAIVNNASVVGCLGSYPSQIAYTASKGGIISMTREIAVCYARRGVRANTICPGITQTGIYENTVETDAHKRNNKEFDHIPIGRSAKPEEISQAVAFLLSEDSSYITAQNWAVDGGMTGAYLCPPFTDGSVPDGH